MMLRPWIGILLLAGGCARPGTEVNHEEGDFALVEFQLFDCTSNDQHLGLEKFLRSLYGTTPSIDLEQGVARLRIPSPARIDPAAIAQGFRRANTGLGWITLTVRCARSPGQVTLFPTGQVFRSQNGEENDKVPRWRTIVIPTRTSEDRSAEPAEVLVE